MTDPHGVDANPPRFPSNGPLDGDEVAYFSQIPTFLRLPVDYTCETADVAILGIPFDGGVTERAGARDGPRGIRVASTTSRPSHGRLGSPYERLRIVDAGDVRCNPLKPDDARLAIASHYARLRETGTRVVAVGGDHSVTLHTLQSLGAPGPVALIHFDAHADSSDIDFGSRVNHATVFRRALESGLYDASKTARIGLRPDLHDDEELAWLRSSGSLILTIDDIRDIGLRAAMSQVVEHVGDHSIYLTVDIDVLDPSYAPGTGSPEPGGLSSADLRSMLWSLDGLSIIGADLVEVAPCYDLGSLTVDLAARLLFDLVCLM